MLALFGIDIGDLVSDAIRKLVDLLVPDFASGWVTSLVTSLVAVPDVTGAGFSQLNGLRDSLQGVGFALLSLCLVAGGLQVWLAGLASGGVRAGELVRRAVVAAGAIAFLPVLLRAATVGTNLATAQLIRSTAVQHGLDSAFGEAFAYGVFTKGLSLGLAIPAAIGIAWFVVALLVMKAGLTALLAVLTLASPIVLGLSPLPQGRWLVQAWAGGLGAALVLPVAWALVFSVAALLAGDTLVLAQGPFASLAKPLAAVACFWLAYRTPGFLLAAGRSVGLHPGTLMAAVPARLGGRGGGSGSGGRGGSAGRGSSSGPAGGPGGRFAALASRAGTASRAAKAGRGATVARRPPGPRSATRGSGGPRSNSSPPNNTGAPAAVGSTPPATTRAGTPQPRDSGPRAARGVRPVAPRSARSQHPETRPTQSTTPRKATGTTQTNRDRGRTVPRAPASREVGGIVIHPRSARPAAATRSPATRAPGPSSSRPAQRPVATPAPAVTGRRAARPATAPAPKPAPRPSARAGSPTRATPPPAPTNRRPRPRNG